MGKRLLLWRQSHITNLIKMVVVILLIYKWLTILHDTDSFFSVYQVCGLIGAVACVYNCVKDIHIYRIPVRERVVSIIFSSLFGLMIQAANYKLLETFGLLDCIVLLFTSCLIGWNILIAGYYFYTKHPLRMPASDKHARLVFLVSFILICTSYLLYLFLAAYPGKLTRDSLSQLDQALSTVTSNLHPFYHTLLLKIIIRLGLALFGDMNHAVAFFSTIQIVFMGGVFAYLLSTLYRMGARYIYIAASIVVFAFSPYHMAFSITMWKDVMFAGAVTLTIVSLYRIMNQLDGKERSIKDTILFCLGSIGFCLWRNNGILAYAITVLIMLLLHIRQLKRVKLYFIISGIVLVTAFIMEYPLLNLLQIKQTDKVEVLSIPEQQVTRAVIDGTVDEQEMAELNKFLNVEQARNDYMTYISDPIKYLIRRDTADYFNNNTWSFLKLWLKIGLKNIKPYGDAWIDITRGYWNGGYEYWIWTDGVQNNQLGISHITHSEALEAAYGSWFERYKSNEFYEPFRSIGLHFWICWFALGIAIIKKDRSGMMLSISLMAIVFTLLIGTSVFSEFRYVYSLFTSAPIVLLSVLHW